MKIKAYPHIVQFITEHPWAILPGKLEAIAEFLSHRLVNGPTPRAMEDDDVPMRRAAASGPAFARAGTTAVIPVIGTIAKRMNMMMEFSGGASIEMASRSLRAALVDPEVSSVILQLDSPGGSVYGVQELGEEIFAGRDTKPIYGIADDLAASAAYWLGSQCTQLSVTPSGEVGSIGVVAMHVDYSKALEDAGIAVTFIHAGDHKVEGNSYEPLDEDAKAFQQSRIDDYYRAFVKAVARGRSVTAGEVNKNFGQGRVFGAEHAKSVGMVDRVETMNELLARAQPKPRAARANRTSASAEADIAQALLKAS